MKFEVCDRSLKVEGGRKGHFVTSKATLIEVFGEPLPEDLAPKEGIEWEVDVRYEWRLRFEDGNTAIVYDLKDDPTKAVDEDTQWYVKGERSLAVRRVVTAIERVMGHPIVAFEDHK
ncbi:hypothetical protein KIPB_010602 [Kipferlia bialata]|uniref:Uncharacterized protein n=1 Tax=Kipferlia bialata TaxID=797122 RepID=A0A9K3D4B0_9EUKA|nr:hypothetical protein KIPB_010602 [Kipferlia bialata]|eukprot:g10602.t1